MDCHQTDAAEQATRRSACKRPSRAQRHLLGPAFRCTVARPAQELWATHDMLQSLRSLAEGWRLGPDHGCTDRSSRCRSADDRYICRASPSAWSLCRGQQTTAMGRSRGGLTTKIHAVVDASGLPVQLGLTPGETHDNQLCTALLMGLQAKSMLLADRGYDADWIRALVNHHGAWANIPPKRNRKDPICFSP